MFIFRKALKSTSLFQALLQLQALCLCAFELLTAGFGGSVRSLGCKVSGFRMWGCRVQGSGFGASGFGSADGLWDVPVSGFAAREIWDTFGSKGWQLMSTSRSI